VLFRSSINSSNDIRYTTYEIRNKFVVKKSTKSAHSNRPNLKKIKKFYLLSYHRLTPIRHQKSSCFFVSNAHIRAFIEALLFFAEGQKEGNDDCSMANSQLPTMNYEQPTTSYANRLNTPKTHRPTNKPPIRPKLSTNYDSIMQNKANLQNARMNLNFYSTKDYENKSNCSLAENKPNTKPIQTQTKPISPALKTTYDIPHTTYEIQTQSNPISEKPK